MIYGAQEVANILMTLNARESKRRLKVTLRIINFEDPNKNKIKIGMKQVQT